jgi:hypothetical protein
MLIWKKHFSKGGILTVTKRGLLLRDSLTDIQPVLLWYGRPSAVWITTETGNKLTAVQNGIIFEIKTLALYNMLGDLEFHITQRR